MAALYVTATPIGNLQDLSPRAVEILKKADLIIAEDTRMTMKLCQVFGFHAPLVSCHRHNEDTRAAELAERIAGEDLTAASAVLTLGNSRFTDFCPERKRT